MRHHDLEARDDLCKWDRAVLLPGCEILGGVDEDDEVLLGALEEDFVLGGVSARHVGGLEVGFVRFEGGVGD